MITYIKSKETSQTSYVAIDKLTRVIYKFIFTFGLIASLVCKFAKSRDKLVNHSCQLVYRYVASLASFLTFYLIQKHTLSVKKEWPRT